MVYRMVVAKNKSNALIEMRERLSSAPPGFYNSIIRLQPSSSHEFQAGRFCNRNRGCGRPAVIDLYVNGRQTPHRLMPEEFLRYVKLLFYVDKSGRLTIKGIQARFADFGRFWGLGFLGREYEGRSEEIIIR